MFHFLVINNVQPQHPQHTNEQEWNIALKI